MLAALLEILFQWFLETVFGGFLELLLRSLFMGLRRALTWPFRMMISLTMRRQCRISGAEEDV